MTNLMEHSDDQGLNIMMTRAIENFHDKVVKHCDDKGMEHCDEKAMEHSDDMCHGAL